MEIGKISGLFYEAEMTGKTKKENTKSHTPVALRKQIGGTMYVVRAHFNEDAE